MEVQREAQKKSRTSIEDTDDVIRFLKSEIIRVLPLNPSNNVR